MLFIMPKACIISQQTHWCCGSTNNVRVRHRTNYSFVFWFHCHCMQTRPQWISKAHDTRTRNSYEKLVRGNLYVCHTDLQQDISRANFSHQIERVLFRASFSYEFLMRLSWTSVCNGSTADQTGCTPLTMPPWFTYINDSGATQMFYILTYFTSPTWSWWCTNYRNNKQQTKQRNKSRMQHLKQKCWRD